MKFEGIFTAEQAEQICEEQDIDIGYNKKKTPYIYLALNLMNAKDRKEMYYELEEKTKDDQINQNFPKEYILSTAEERTELP